VNISKLILKFIQRDKRQSIPKKIFNKKYRVKGMTLSYFKTYKTIIIKTVWYWSKTKIDQQKKTENPEIDQYSPNV
jgi:hypothetical protein